MLRVGQPALVANATEVVVRPVADSLPGFPVKCKHLLVELVFQRHRTFSNAPDQQSSATGSRGAPRRTRGAVIVSRGRHAGAAPRAVVSAAERPSAAAGSRGIGV